MRTSELKAIDRKLIIYQLIGFPGTVAVGLGLFGLFGGGGELIPILASRNFSAFIATAGACTMIWEATKVFPLLKRRSELESNRR